MRKASSEMSQPTTWAFSPSRCLSAKAMHPLPVPMSRMRISFDEFVLFCTSSAMSITSSSVSGRGISTPGATPIFSPQKGWKPNTYCTGSPLLMRSAIKLSLILMSSGSASSRSISTSAVVSPATSSSSKSDMARASPSLQMPSAFIADCSSLQSLMLHGFFSSSASRRTPN